MYISIDDIKQNITEAELKRLCNDASDLNGELNANVITIAITSVCQLIDDFLRGRYTTPLISPNAVVKDIAINLTVYKLYERRMVSKMPEGLINSYNNAISLLKKYQNGEMEITTKEAPEIKPTRLSVVRSRSQKYTSELMSRFNR